MVTLEYQVEINASLDKVWDLLWNEKTYPEWTQFFMQGSQLKTDWKINGKTYFLDAENNGIVGTIKSMNEPHEIIFSHLGTFKNGVEDTKSRDVVEWSGYEEKYFLRDIGNYQTELRAVFHTENDQKEFMESAFAKGFALIKNLAEKS